MNKRTWKMSNHIFLSIMVTLITTLLDVFLRSSTGINIILKIKQIISIFYNNKSASIGIIGGADGPTAIYLNGNPILALVYSKIFLLFILLMLYIPTKKYIFKSN